MQNAHSTQSGNPALDPAVAAHITTTFREIVGTPSLLHNTATAIQEAEEIGKRLAAMTDALFKIAPWLDDYTEFMTNNQDYLFEEAGGDIWKLIQIIHRDRNRYAHLAHTLRNCTAADQKNQYNSQIPDAILRKATHELMKLYKEKTGKDVVYAKELETGRKQPSTVFIFECLKIIDPSITPQRAKTAINNARKELKSRI